MERHLGTASTRAALRVGVLGLLLAALTPLAAVTSPTSSPERPRLATTTTTTGTASTSTAASTTTSTSSTSTVASTTTTTALPRSAPSDRADFVRACGTNLCINGRTWSMFGASVLFAIDDPEPTLRLVPQAGINTIRIVDEIDWKSPNLIAAPFDERHWANVDRLLALARDRGLHVILDVSSVRNLYLEHRMNPYVVDWGPFVRFVTSRVNTVTGIAYRDDPTIALISVAGEVDGLDQPGPLYPTPAELVEFYRRTFAQLREADPNHLLSTGGLTHLDYPADIPWREIFALADCDVVAIHTYSRGDEQLTLPVVAANAASIGKPWINEEFGFKQELGDSARAAATERVYSESAVHGAAGISIWNLGPQVQGSPGVPETYDVNESTPLTLATMRRHAPAS